MHSRFDVNFGQQLCDALSAELGFVCNFMGEDGRIVASGERERIGCIHDIAAQIMRGEFDEYGVSKEEAAQSATMREGINMGIDVDGKRLISFSVAGPLEIVRPLAHLVRFCVASLLRFRQEATLPELSADQSAVPVPSATSLMEMLNQAEFRVEERARELRDFAELSADWFWTQDAEFRFTGFSGLSTDKLQRKQSDFFGKRRWEMPIFGVSAAQLAEHIATCERHEPFRNFEYQIPSADGVPQYYFISGTPVFDKYGVFTGYHGNGTNITELRLAELAIKESERQLSQIVDGSSIPTFVIDAEHRVTHWNQACANLTGFNAQQMLGSKEVWRAFYPLPRPTMADLVLAGASDAEVANYYQNFTRSVLIEGAVEAENFHPHMREGGLWLYFTAAPLRGADGKLSGALETIQDITERRRDQQLLEERSEALQQAYSEMEARVAERTSELSQQLHFLQQLIEAIPGPVYYKDADSHYLGCNSAYEAFTGRSLSEIIGKTPHDIAPKELADTYIKADRQLLDNPGTQIYEAQVRFASGENRDVMFHKATFTRPDGSVGGLVGLMLDITERKQMEDNLRQAATVFNNSAEGVTIAMPDGTIIAVNRAFTEITGYAEREVIGKNPRMFQSGRHDKQFYREMWASIAANGRWQGEVWNRRKSGENFPEWISITAVRDKEGRLTNYVATFSDITHQKQAEERIRMLAFSDPLTSLPNRRLLLDRLEHALVVSTRSKCYGALFFIDLDDFKGLNDTRGHHVGDLLLKQVALRIVSAVRDGDTVARFGGDEFVVMLENLSTNPLEATSLAEFVGEKILAALNEPYMLQDSPQHSTPSIGVTLFSDQQSSLEELLKQADLAMYRAKASGRNALRFFDPEMQAVVAARVAMETDLRQGLLKQQFVLHYQPQVDHTSTVTGAEALIRWQHPQRGMVSPAEFIPLAEETGQILPLGLWVLETACAQLSVWAKSPETTHLTLAVNVSAHQFRQTDFVDQVLQICERNALGSGKLKLELTESLLLDDIEDIISKMIVLKANGVCFSLDDFGTGYSSLSYLKRLPLDQLKIDQSFVRDVLTDPDDAAIARTIVALAHSLGMAVIAEGVETEEQLLFLSSHGCHAYQGYLFSRPLPLADFEQFVWRDRAHSGNAQL
jgi:diguanylate cyclase (GGDEF)-like protein/PAS domain S-box-containing protein